MKKLCLLSLVLLSSMYFSQQSTLIVRNVTASKYISYRIWANQSGTVDCLPRIDGSMYLNPQPPNSGVNISSYNNGMTTGIGAISDWGVRTSNNPPTTFSVFNGNMPQFFVDNTDWAGVSVRIVNVDGSGVGNEMSVGRLNCNSATTNISTDLYTNTYTEYIEVVGFKMITIIDL